MLLNLTDKVACELCKKRNQTLLHFPVQQKEKVSLETHTCFVQIEE